MTYDSIILAAIVAELNRELAGGRIDSIHQPAPLDVVLVIRSNRANHSLLISADPRSPRVHLTSVKRPNPKTPPGFTMLMRKYLEGGRITGIEQVGFDRILHLKIAGFDGEPLTLIVEIMGKHSNIILVDATEKILGAVKPIGRTKNRYREVLPGRQYVAPPTQNKLDPRTVAPETIESMVCEAFPGARKPGELAQWLTKTFTGIAPFLGKELEARSLGSADLLSAPGGEDAHASNVGTTAVAPEFTDLFRAVRNNDFIPVLISDAAGRTIGYYAFPSLQYPMENQHERPSISTVADVYYNSALPREALEESKSEFLARLQKELESREHAFESMQETLEECAGAERFKQIGELILAQATSIAPESESAELQDYYDPSGGLITIELDPNLSPPENAESWFKKYHKAVTGAESLKDRMVETRDQIVKLRQALEAAEGAASEARITELANMLIAEGLHVRKKAEAPAAKQKPEFEGYRISKSVSGGWEILIGENSESNDHLLTRVAKPSDIWLHVKASPSSHVVIRANGKPERVPPAVLQAAAELTVKHSSSKHSSLVPVDYTLRKYVRKPKGAPAGKALYTHEKTIYINP
jgi:predicted ribosome quality control (RQC) complex YloA/Tae2 family protein